MTGDLALLNAKIYTLNEESKVEEALIVRQGKIVFIGSSEEALKRLRKGEKTLDLNGKPVLPGFIDSHSHLQSYGINLTYSLDLSSVKSLKEALMKIKEKTSEIPEGKWIIGFRWDESRWSERRYPNRVDLDSVAYKHPVALFRVDGHLCVVNSEALNRIQAPKKLRGLELDEEGKPTGILKEDALSFLMGKIQPGLEERVKGTIRGVEEAHKLGITSIHEIGDYESFKAYKKLRDEGKLKIRVNFLVLYEELEKFREKGFGVGWGDEWLKVGGVKLLVDGSLGARTAALSEEYADDPGNKGILLHEEKALTKIVSELNERSIQVAIHAIGDRGISLALKTLSEALNRKPRENHRHRLEHFELPGEEHLELMKKLGLIASMQPNFIGEWGLPSGMYEKRLGGGRLKESNPYRKILDSGIKLAFGSDCMPPSPLYGIHCAVNAPFESQRITVEEAVKCYTMNGAYSSFEEELKGSIKVGKLADLVVLSDDPFNRPEEIKDLKIIMTIVDGEIVYSAD